MKMKKRITRAFGVLLALSLFTAMIGCAGYHNFINGKIDDMSLNAVPNLKIDIN